MATPNKNKSLPFKLIKIIGDTYYVKFPNVKVLVEMSKSYYLWMVNQGQLAM